MSEEYKAVDAIQRIRKACAPILVCCECPVPGASGDGWMQPPDPPSCCGEPCENVGMLLDEIAAELASIRSELEAARGKVEALTFELGCARGHLRTAIELPSDGRKARAAIRAAREFLEARQPCPMLIG